MHIVTMDGCEHVMMVMTRLTIMMTFNTMMKMEGAEWEARESEVLWEERRRESRERDGRRKTSIPIQ